MMSPAKEPTHPVDWLREDMRDLRREVSDRFDRLGDMVEGIGERLDRHCTDPRAHLLPDSSTSIVAPGRRRGANFAAAARVWGPLLLAAALGLLGLGAYVGSGMDDAETTRAIRAVTDSTTKLARDLENIRAAVDAGGQK